MQYMLLGPDGHEYGPADVPTLKEWADDRRLNRESQLKTVDSGEIVAAGSVKGIFEPLPRFDAPPVFTAPAQSERTELWATLIYSAIALIAFFWLNGFGFLIAGFTMWAAIRAKSQGDRYGTICVVVAAGTLLALLIGVLVRWNAA